MNRLTPLTNSLHAVGLGISSLVASSFVAGAYLHETFEAEVRAAETANEFLMERAVVEASLSQDIEKVADRITGLKTAVGDTCMKLVDYTLESEDIERALSGEERCEHSDAYIFAIRRTLENDADEYADLRKLQKLVEPDSSNVATAQAIVDDGSDKSVFVDFLAPDRHVEYATVEVGLTSDDSYFETQESSAYSADVGILHGLAALGFVASAALLSYGIILETRERLADRRSRRSAEIKKEEIQALEDLFNKQ